MKQQKFFQLLRIGLFCVALAVGCVVGFLLPLRPETSESELRDLTEFPAFDAGEFMDGTYTSSIGLWYSDTFPGREALIALNTRLRGWYGIKTTMADAGEGGDDPSEDDTFVWSTTPPEPPESGATEPVTSVPPADPGHEIIKGYLVEGNKGFELYYFNRQNSDRYARFVVQTALDLDGQAQVYAMVTPMSYAFGVDPDTQADLNASDCEASIDWIYRAIEQYGVGAGLSSPVITVDAYGALSEHTDEYIFFRTDHHWTALGAHYASRAFLDAAGKRYPSLDAYGALAFEGFTGSIAGHTKQDTPNLIRDPDTIHAFVPPSINEITITTTKGETLIRPLVNPNAEAEFGASQRYRCFIDGDYPFSVAHNSAVGDGSAILLIKESYGNAFLPMLVDSYEYVYAVDYRFFRTMRIDELVEEYGIDTVLFINNPVATSADYNMNCLEKLVYMAGKD